MAIYLIERDLPGASMLSSAELREISAKSNEVVAGLGVPYRWITSYVAGDKIYCVHETTSPDTVRRHGELGGFPFSSITEVASVISPATGQG
ncbi:MAG: DUF4242 domain-containing protein [Aestuariivirga sp.]|uniref:DUF4242 domain-containing protein n=1 Tax=Aestuariivirga sp. TaxID=2650926 RepID=UPI0030190124